MGTADILCGWALQGYLVVGQYKDTLRLGTADILCGWALQGYVVVGQCKDTLRLGTAGILGGWSGKSASSRARTTSILKSNNPTARVGNNPTARVGKKNERSSAVTATQPVAVVKEGDIYCDDGNASSSSSYYY